MGMLDPLRSYCDTVYHEGTTGLGGMRDALDTAWRAYAADRDGYTADFEAEFLANRTTSADGDIHQLRLQGDRTEAVLSQDRPDGRPVAAPYGELRASRWTSEETDRDRFLRTTLPDLFETVEERDQRPLTFSGFRYHPKE